MSWLKEAEHLTKHKFLAIPLNNGVPTVKYDKRREILASEQELSEWYLDKKVNGIAIAINKTEFAIDTDGEECENIFVEKVIAQLSKNLQNKINKTMYTKSPHGHHRTFRIKLEDFPDGIKTDKYLVIGNNHSEIAVVGKEHILRERSPEHKVINGVECLVILEKAEVDELFKALNKLKESDAAMKVADLLLPYYYQPHRDAIIFSLSGFLHKSKTPQHITEKIALHLINLTKYHDEDTNKVLRTIKDTYAKDRNSADVSGYNKFLEALEAAYPHKDRIGNDNNGNDGSGQNQRIIYTLNYKNTIIDAIPTKVIINESPIDGTKTYQITFSHKGVGRPFTVGPGSVKTIIALLQDRGRYIDEDADKFLT